MRRGDRSATVLAGNTTLFSYRNRNAALEAVRDRRGHAYAEASEAAAVAVETLGSIRWIDDKAVFVGPVTRTAAP